MKTEKEIREQLASAYNVLEKIDKDTPPGMGIWRSTRRYIDGLEWVLDEETHVEIILTSGDNT